jgi:flagellar motor switch/type III secretory pathway protein FliN
MSPEAENKLTTNADAVVPPNGSPVPGGAPAALLLRGEGLENPSAEPQRDTRLDRMPMQLDVMVKVRAFRVEDLLALEQGTVVETIHQHSQDVPVQCGGALLVWAEFEVVEQRLAVRVTRLA